MKLRNPNLLVIDGWIDGKPVRSEQRFLIHDPATQQSIAEVSDLGASETNDAIAAATQAFADWKNRSREERVELVLAWAELIEENTDDLGVIVCSENGKPYREARGEVLQSAALLRWFATGVEQQAGEDFASPDGVQKNYTIKQAVGVVACITPWNFPAAAIAVKSGAAISTGCTTVIKPSDETPLIALAFAQLASQAGLPDGVINVVPCKDPAAVGNALCSSPDVRMLSFTGSTKVGKMLYSACGDTVKKLALELGGNAPFIVFDDADLERAVAGAMGARFYNSGQICVGANRFLVQKNIYPEFSARFADQVNSMTSGSGCDESSDIGPMINRAAIDRLNRILDSSLSMGARVLAGGARDNGESLFFDATVLADMTTQMPAYQAEIFGPIACLYPFDEEDDALRLANDTQAGLSAYVYTSDRRRLLRFSEELDAGVVGANSTNIFSNDLPFGGVKQSGIGKEHGMQCLDEYVETKSVCLGQ